jgi:hypothetical protein
MELVKIKVVLRSILKLRSVSKAGNIVINNPTLCKEISNNGIHKMAPTAWETQLLHMLHYLKIFDKK